MDLTTVKSNLSSRLKERQVQCDRIKKECKRCFDNARTQSSQDQCTGPLWLLGVVAGCGCVDLFSRVREWDTKGGWGKN